MPWRALGAGTPCGVTSGPAEALTARHVKPPIWLNSPPVCTAAHAAPEWPIWRQAPSPRWPAVALGSARTRLIAVARTERRFWRRREDPEPACLRSLVWLRQVPRDGKAVPRSPLYGYPERVRSRPHMERMSPRLSAALVRRVRATPRLWIIEVEGTRSGSGLLNPVAFWLFAGRCAQAQSG